MNPLLKVKIEETSVIPFDWSPWCLTCTTFWFDIKICMNAPFAPTLLLLLGEEKKMLSSTLLSS